MPRRESLSVRINLLQEADEELPPRLVEDELHVLRGQLKGKKYSLEELKNKKDHKKHDYLENKMELKKSEELENKRSIEVSELSKQVDAKSDQVFNSLPYHILLPVFYFMFYFFFSN